MTKKLFAFVASVLVVAVFTAACAGAATAQPSDASDLDAQIRQAILQANAGQYSPSDFASEAHEILAVQEEGDTLVIYATALYLEFGYGRGCADRDRRQLHAGGYHVQKGCERYL